MHLLAAAVRTDNLRRLRVSDVHGLREFLVAIVAMKNVLRHGRSPAISYPQIAATGFSQKLNLPVSSKLRGPPPSAVCSPVIDPKPPESTCMLGGS